jgi:hypothetical protein
MSSHRRALQIRALQITVVLLATAARALCQTTTQPSTVPASPAIAGLIRQLGSEQWQDRETAQQQLIALGPAAVEALTKAAEADDADPEVRSRAAAALVAIREQDVDGPSLLTIHFKNAAVQQVLDSIAAQAHTQFNTESLLVPQQQTLTIDADRRPFWEVMEKVCADLGVAPTYEDRNSSQILLQPTPQNWLTKAPHQVIGPYAISVIDVHRARRVDLTGTQAVDERFGVQMILFAEPKVTVTQLSHLDLRSATDDAGNSLVPAGADAASARAMNYGPTRSGQQIDVPLRYPDHPGTKIATLRGALQVGVGQNIQRFQVDELFGALKVTHALSGRGIEVQANKAAGDTYTITVTLKRGSLPHDQWLAMTNQVANIYLEDADEHRMSVAGWSGSGSDDEYKFTGHYRRMQFAARFGQPVGPRRLGEPTRLVWEVPTKVKVVAVNVEFRDLPMP